MPPPLVLLRNNLERWLIVWLVLLSGLAYQWPGWSAAWWPTVASWDPFLQSSGYLRGMFAVAMLAIGSLLPADEVRQVFRRWPTVLAGTVIQYTSMPLLAYAIGRALHLEGAAMIGIVVVGCVPGAMASNMLTLIARGNVSYSVSLTTSSTVLSPLVVPWILWLALGRMVENFPAWEVCRDLCWMVVLPVITGHVLSRRLIWWSQGAQHSGALIANLTILWIVAVVVASNRDGLARLDARLVLALSLVNVLGYAAGYGGALALRLPVPMRRALTLEVGMQNAGLGSTLALGLFADPAAAIPAALYTFGCMFTGTLLARIWAGREAPQGGSETT